MEKKTIPAEKPSLKSRGKKLHDGMAIGMPEDLETEKGKTK